MASAPFLTLNIGEFTTPFCKFATAIYATYQRYLPRQKLSAHLHFASKINDDRHVQVLLNYTMDTGWTEVKSLKSV